MDLGSSPARPMLAAKPLSEVASRPSSVSISCLVHQPCNRLRSRRYAAMLARAKRPRLPQSSRKDSIAEAMDSAMGPAARCRSGALAPLFLFGVVQAEAELKGFAQQIEEQRAHVGMEAFVGIRADAEQAAVGQRHQCGGTELPACCAEHGLALFAGQPAALGRARSQQLLHPVGLFLRQR